MGKSWGQGVFMGVIKSQGLILPINMEEGFIKLSFKERTGIYQANKGRET